MVSHTQTIGAPDITWGTLQSPDNSTASVLVPNIQQQQRPQSVSVSMAQAMSPFPLQILQQSNHTKELRRLVQPTQNQTVPPAHSVTPAKRPRQESFDLPPPGDNQLQTAVSTTGDSHSEAIQTPLHTQPPTPSSNQYVTPSRSSKRARPPPGSPVWNYSGGVTVDGLLLDPDYTLYLQVYATCLMHAIYRPFDTSRTIMILEPTPVDGQTALLVWGTCELVDDLTLDIELTYYDNRARIPSSTLVEEVNNWVWTVVENNLPCGYNMGQKVLWGAKWSEDYHTFSEIELDMVFCQIISAVVYDMPFHPQILADGPPLMPRWPYEMTQAQIQTLLGQRVDGSLSYKALVSENDFVPERIYLHGYPFEAEILPMHDTLEGYGFEEQEEVEEVPSVPMEDIFTRHDSLNSSKKTNFTNFTLLRTEAWIEQKAALEATGQQHYYLMFSDKLRYQTATPSIASEFSVHVVEPGPNRSVVMQRDLIAKTHDCMLAHRKYRHTARLVYWKQLRESTPDMDCISFVTTNLWLSSLMAAPDRCIFYLDPNLVTTILELYRNNPSELDGNIPELFGRQDLWDWMGPLARILAILKLDDLCEPSPGKLSWTLLELGVEKGRVTTVDVVLAPCTNFNKPQFTQLLLHLIEALNKILPARPLMLNQEVATVDVQTMRQGLCFYFDLALRNPEVDYSFPWPGLTDEVGMLLTEYNQTDVARKRFHLAHNQEPSPIEMFSRRRSYAATVATPGPSEPFFLELAQSHSSHAEGILMHTSGRSIDALDKAILLGQYPSFNPLFSTTLDGPNTISPEELTELVYSLGGPEDPSTHNLLMTGEHEDQSLVLGWEKNAIYPQPEWLLTGYDLDSLTLTCSKVPEILEAGSYHPYPNRDLSLIYNNELTVKIQGKPVKMHTCPNFCIMTFGANNQFSEMEDWYHTFLTALRFLRSQVPYHLQHVVEKTIEALPSTYNMASNQVNQGGGTRSFLGHRLEPVILNLVFPMLATMNIHGRDDDDPLKYALQSYGFIDWFAQNPHDIVADIGWTTNVHRPSMPEELKRSTMLFRYAAMQELLRPAYKTPHFDRYCASFSVGGGRALPYAAIKQDSGVSKVQFYPKDMVLTYRHRNKSVGANFTVSEALGVGNQTKFSSAMKAFQDVMLEADTYGLCFEVRLSAWGANQFMKRDPWDILDRMLAAEAIASHHSCICYPTESLAHFKVMLSKGWSSIIQRQRQLSTVSRRSPEVVLLTSVLAYWLRSLVKRPDEQSATKQMVDDLQLTETAKNRGFPFLRSEALDPNGLQVSYVVNPNTFGSLSYPSSLYQLNPGKAQHQSPALPLGLHYFNHHLHLQEMAKVQIPYGLLSQIGLLRTLSTMLYLMFSGVYFLKIA
ncbi:hypothetical protein RHS01_11040 [Rhizoctonia solani]|uniref:Uncharacterized protein n=1 Tax=Rhizoctonia solani TaxID=456999 RepID=A0A8H7I0M0_9AGAM|nr:hypothetical protein RHS01_11040 [Rhizoctonia solani]